MAGSKVTPRSWAFSLLQALSLPTTDRNIAIIMGWEQGEGGAGPQFGISGNAANFNPLNTSQTEPGSTTVGAVQSYPDWQTGLKATIETLQNGKYGAILDMLKSGNADPQSASDAVNNSVWGTKDLSTFLIQHQNTKDDGGALVTTTGVGGVAGLGGTGTGGNDTGGSQFSVGDTSNPDEDYWTAINRLSQDRQWYFFSDGETLYLADGADLMAQTPAVSIDRIKDADKIVHLEFTWDNTAWQYSVSHKHKKTVKRRSALARVQSPVEATLHLICPIDAVRGGDVVFMTGCGPGDGAWLVSNCRRSVFQVYSEITLVPALSPLSEQQVAGATPGGTSASGSTGGGPASPGGYVNPFSKIQGLTPERIDMGVDFSGTGDIVAIGDAHVFWTDGAGWPGPAFIGLKLLNGAYQGKLVYFAEDINAAVHVGDTVKAGDKIGTMFNGGSGIECGWASGQGNGTLASQLGQASGGGDPGANSAAAGYSFNNFLKSLGVPSGKPQGPPVGKMPSGYP